MSDERRQWAADLNRSEVEFKRQDAALEREHEAQLAAAQDAKRKALAAYEAREELQRSWRAKRDELWGRLRGTRDHAIDVFVQDMNELLAELPALQRAVTFARMGEGSSTAVDNSASIGRRRAAIQVSITQAERLSLEALDADVLARRLAALRDALPPVEDIEVLAAAAKARRYGPAPIEAA